MSKSIQEIFVVRALAILGVIMVHSTSSIVVDLNTTSSMYIVYNFFNIFFKFGTPTFIFLSSFVLFLNYFKRDFNSHLIINFYKRRLMYIILPYLIFSIFYYSIVATFYYSFPSIQAMLIDFLKRLLIGKSYAHLYFVFISIQFYIIFPLLLWLFKKYQFIRKYSIIIGILLQWTFVLINHYDWHYANKGSIALSYMSYYFLGAFLGVYYDSIIKYIRLRKVKLFSKISILWFSIWSVWLISGLGYVYLWYWTRVYGKFLDSLVYEGAYHLYTYTSTIVLLQLSYWLYGRLSVKINSIIIHLGITSFGIYLIHPFFLLLYRKIPVSGNPMFYHSWVAGGFLVALLFSWTIVGFVMKKNQYAWIIFGSAPKQTVSKLRQSREKAEEVPGLQYM